MTSIRTAIILFALIVVLGPLYTVSGYSVMANLISELGAQHTSNNIIMKAGFFIIGTAIIFAPLREWSWTFLPFQMFGAGLILAGLFSHKPIDAEQAYSVSAHNLHGVAATFSGFAITIGLVWQAVLRKTMYGKLWYIGLAAMCTFLPLLMLNMPHMQGLIQRVMYLFIFVWFWQTYPDQILTHKQKAAR